VVRAKTYEEALRLPSEHDYGNGVAIFTRDGDTARDFATRVNVGMVGVNFAIPVPLSYYTFGGWKRSGFGDLNQHGPDAVRFYTKTKTVTSRWPSGIKEGAEFVIPTMKGAREMEAAAHTRAAVREGVLTLGFIFPTLRAGSTATHHAEDRPWPNTSSTASPNPV